MAQNDYEAAYENLDAGNVDEAVRRAEAILAREPDHTGALHILGLVAYRRHRLDESLFWFERILKVDPDHIGVLARKFAQRERELLDRMLAVLNGGQLDVSGRVLLGIAISKAFDDLGEYELAVKHRDEAKQLVLQGDHERFELSALVEHFAKTKFAFTPSTFTRVADRLESELPILIVGFPRSGIRFVEQILSSHSAVAAGGAQTLWLDAAKALPEGATSLAEHPAEAIDLGCRYLDRMEKLGGGAHRVTDGLPENFQQLGLIHLALPGARIIHCRRNAFDNCVSVYLAPKSGGDLLGREDIKAYYRAYQALMDHWRGVLPVKAMLDVDYEALVAAPEPTARRILEFCGMPWEDACAPRVHPSSVGRGERYRPWLDTFEELLPGRPGKMSAEAESAHAHAMSGFSLRKVGKLREAVEEFRRAVSLKPEIGALALHLGTTLEAIGDRNGAKDAYIKAAFLDPEDVESRLYLASQLLVERNVPKARDLIDEAIKLAPENPQVLFQDAEVLLMENRLAEADARLAQGLRLAPNDVGGLCRLGFRQLNAGDFNAARESFLRLLDINPLQGLGYLGWAQCRKATEEDLPMLERMEAVQASNKVQASEAGSLGFAIGKTLDDLERYGLAMAAYDRVHARELAFRFRNKPFDPAMHRKAVDQIMDLYFKEHECRGIDSELPILIVGMIRSGTTLVEQILSNHPHVGASGENLFWQTHQKEAEDRRRLTLDAVAVERLGRAYVQDLQARSPSALRVTDKLPANYLRLGLIRHALPKAKIIHCRRSPISTAFSIYTTPNPGAPAFTHTKEGIVATYREYQRLMDFWRSLLPKEDFLEIDYEELVAHPEPTIRHLLGFCGLKWHSACLHPEHNKREVATPSLWQVRQPIYGSSVERWRRYEPWLGAFRELLPPA